MTVLEARETNELLDASSDTSISEKGDQLSEFLERYAVIDNGQLVLNGGYDANIYTSAQEMVDALNKNGASFAYAMDGAVTVNPQESSDLSTFASGLIPTIGVHWMWINW